LPGDDGSVGGKVKAAPKNFARRLLFSFFPGQGEAAQTRAGWCLFADWGKGATPTSFRLLFFFVSQSLGFNFHCHSLPFASTWAWVLVLHIFRVFHLRF
jgi:hypothetical protein